MAPATNLSNTAEIYDIRQSNIKSSMKDEILQGLRRGPGKKNLPSMLCYDEAGLKLFEDITYLDEYYLTNAEIDVLNAYSEQLAERILPDSMLVELGSGNLRKVRILLDAVEKKQKNVIYYALDLSLSELERTLGQIPNKGYRYVTCRGLHGTYEDGLAWLKAAENQSVPKCVMSLGSSIGNFDRPDAASFLKSFAASLTTKDSLLIGIDNCQDASKIFAAYNDSQNVTSDFYRNALVHANQVLGSEVFQPSQWEIVTRYNSEEGRHEASVAPKVDVSVGGLHFKARELIHLEYSHKFSVVQQRHLFAEAGLQARASYSIKAQSHSLNLLAVPPAVFPSEPKHYAASPVPSLQEWRDMWVAWDLVSKAMIPETELLSKPINLRNCCLFYLGHIPTFLDIHLTRAAGTSSTEPAHYPQIFERGIDPDVENPDLCHAHSEIPDEWPLAEEILDYSHKVRSRVVALYKDGSALNSRRLGRALWLGIEHEAMHMETLLYMLLQSEKMRPPPGPKPDFAALAKQAQAVAKPEKWVAIPPRELVLGMEDAADNSGKNTYFGWDNERPVRRVEVLAFEASTHAITNGEYAKYMESCNINACPASWVPQNVSNGTKTEATSNGDFLHSSHSFIDGKHVKTVFGPIPLVEALDWPLMASYNELAAYAKWRDGRIPTMEEARSIYAYVEELDPGLQSNVSKTIPAVNGHLINGGVEETPPSSTALPSASCTTELANSPDPTSLFADLRGCNVGFQAFHPMPVSLLNGGSDKLAGLSGLGGVWEWTSSVLERHEGFEPMEVYPGYTADFFDGKHNVVLGGSWATHPRIAGRRSFVNWYQRNYPYAWCGARLVRDIKSQ